MRSEDDRVIVLYEEDGEGNVLVDDVRDINPPSPAPIPPRMDRREALYALHELAITAVSHSARRDAVKRDG